MCKRGWVHFLAEWRGAEGRCEFLSCSKSAYKTVIKMLGMSGREEVGCS